MAWNRSSGAPKVAPKKKPSAMRGIVAGLVVVALALACAVMFMGKDDAPAVKADKKPTKIKEVTPAAAPKAAVAAESAPKGKPKFRQEKKTVAAAVEKKTSDDDELPPLPKNCVADFRVRKKDRKALFDDPVQLQLQEFVVPGRDTPPPDRVTDQQALQSCIAGVKFLETDTEEQRATKESVKQMLGQLKDWLRQGRHADEFFEELYRRQQNEHMVVSEVRRETLKIAAEGNDENTKDAMRTYGTYLEKQGLPPVKIVKLRRLENEVKNEKAKQAKEEQK